MIGVYHLWQLFNGECFYCGVETWVPVHESKKAAKERLGIKTFRELHARMASREHLHRRAEGGADTVQNLVLSCNQCNTSRGRKPVLLYLSERRSHANP